MDPKPLISTTLERSRHRVPLVTSTGMHGATSAAAPAVPRFAAGLCHAAVDVYASDSESLHSLGGSTR